MSEEASPVSGSTASGSTASRSTLSDPTPSGSVLSSTVLSAPTPSGSFLSGSAMSDPAAFTTTRNADFTVPGTTMADRPGTLGRRVGYGIAALLNLTLLVLINGTPGWRAVPVLTADTVQVIPLVTFSLLLGTLVNLLSAASGRRWAHAGGEFVSSTIAVMMLSRVWDVFPFAYPDMAVDWALITRVVIGAGIVACVLSMVAQTVILVRIVLADGSDARY